MATPRDTYIELPGRGLRLHCLDWGGDGTPIVLLHGLSSSARIWDLTTPHLVPRFHVIAVDQRSHGQSDRPDDGYGFDDTTADIAAVIAKLGIERPVVVGHSWGANVALQLAADYPDAARGIVLVDGGFIERSGDSTWEQAEADMRPPDIDGTPVERFLGFVRNWPNLKDIYSPQIEQMVLANFDVRDGKIYRPLSIPNHMKIARAIYEQKPSELLRRVALPVLIVPAIREAAGEAERRWQEYREQGLAAIRRVRPDIRVQPMLDSIHDVPVQRPAELARVIAEFAGELA
jgi:pimeloyl-ACP methyl ester carboxylesterase